MGSKREATVSTVSKSIPPHIKILASLSFQEIETFQAFKKTKGRTIANFLEITLAIYTAKNPKVEIILLLDNPKSNHCRRIHKLVRRSNLLLLYNAVSSPHKNTIDYLFEFLKRKIRNEISSSTKFIIDSVIEQAQKFGKDQIVCIWQKQKVDFRKVMNSQDLFIYTPGVDDALEFG